VIALQQVGFLPSEKPKMTYSTDAQLDHVSAFIEALGLEDVVMVGESYGGWVTAAYAARAARPASGLAPVARFAIVCGAVGLTEPRRRQARGFVDDTLAAEIEARLGDLNPFEAANDPTRQAILEESDLVRGQPDAVALSRIAVPTLLLWGEQDEMVPLDYGRAAAAAIPGAQLVVLPNVGHIPSVEAPAEFIRIITDFAAKP
jgi:pimeloyl-ACP methyl ester carboxylesterase